jgi:plasmid stabilization system protein ParE
LFPTRSSSERTSVTGYEGPLYEARLRKSQKIFDYLHERNPQAARAVVGLIHQRISELGDQPYKGGRTNKPNIYTLWITRVGIESSTALTGKKS